MEPLTLLQSCSPPVSSGLAYLTNDERAYGDNYFFSGYSPESLTTAIYVGMMMIMITWLISEYRLSCLVCADAQGSLSPYDSLFPIVHRSCYLSVMYLYSYDFLCVEACKLKQTRVVD